MERIRFFNTLGDQFEIAPRISFLHFQDEETAGFVLAWLYWGVYINWPRRKEKCQVDELFEDDTLDDMDDSDTKEMVSLAEARCTCPVCTGREGEIERELSAITFKGFQLPDDLRERQGGL